MIFLTDSRLQITLLQHARPLGAVAHGSVQAVVVGAISLDRKDCLRQSCDCDHRHRTICDLTVVSDFTVTGVGKDVTLTVVSNVILTVASDVADSCR